MKLQEDVIKYITTVVDTAKITNVENLVFEEGRVRGMNEDQTVVLLQEENVPDFPFPTMGLNQISSVSSRFNVFFKLLQNVKEVNGTDPTILTTDFSVNLSIDEERNFVRSIQLKALEDNLKVGIRCSNPVHVKAPRVIHDTIVNTFIIDKIMVDALTLSPNAMGNVEDVTFHTTKNGFTFTLYDQNNEEFVYTFGNKNPDTHFHHKYPLKVLVSLLKQNVDGELGVGEKGVLQTVINDLNLYILPRS